MSSSDGALLEAFRAHTQHIDARLDDFCERMDRHEAKTDRQCTVLNDPETGVRVTVSQIKTRLSQMVEPKVVLEAVQFVAAQKKAAAKRARTRKAILMAVVIGFMGAVGTGLYGLAANWWFGDKAPATAPGH